MKPLVACIPLLLLHSCITRALWEGATTRVTYETKVEESCILAAEGMRVPRDPLLEPVRIPVAALKPVPAEAWAAFANGRACLALAPRGQTVDEAQALVAVLDGVGGLEPDTVRVDVESLPESGMQAVIEVSGSMTPAAFAMTVGVAAVGEPVDPSPELRGTLERFLDPAGRWAPLVLDLDRWGMGPVAGLEVRLLPSERAEAIPRDAALRTLMSDRARTEGRTLLVSVERDGERRCLAIPADLLWLTNHLMPEVGGTRFLARSSWSARFEATLPPMDAGVAHDVPWPTVVTYTENRIEERVEDWIWEDVLLATILTPVTLVVDVFAFAIYDATEDVD